MAFRQPNTTLSVASFISLVAVMVFSVTTVKANTLSHYLSQSQIISEIGNSTITAIRQSSDGFLWLGTQHGLYRFDGANITHFSNKQNSPIRLPFSDIRGITEDPYGNLLVATFGGGLLRLSLDSGEFQPISQRALKDHLFIQHIYDLDNGYIVFTSDNNVSILGKDLVREESWIDSNQFYKDIVNPSGIASGVDGNIVIGSAAGLFIVSPELQNITRAPLGSIEGEITSLIGGVDEHVIFSTSSGFLVKYSMTTKSIVKKIHFPEGSTRGITDLAIFDDYIWIGTDSGLLQTDITLSVAKDYHIDNSLLFSNHITSLYVSDNTLWIGSFKGLNTISVTPFFTFNHKNSFVFDDVLSFEEDKDGDLWVGTYNGLYRRSQGALTHERFEDRVHATISHRPVMAIAAIESDIWLGLWRDGVRIMNTENNRIRKLETPFGHNLAVTGIYHIGQETWISTYDYGLIAVDRRTLEIISTPISAPVTTALNIDNNNILVASDTKLYLVSDSGDSVIQLTPWDMTTQPPMILSLEKSPHGEIFVGTKDHGLFTWKEPDFDNIDLKLTRYLSSSDLNDITIYGMEIDTSDNLWCATEQGVFKFPTNESRVSRFTRADGLQGDNFNSGASYVDSQGIIYFGGVNGYTSFSPKEVRDEKASSEMALTQISIPTRTHEIHNPRNLELIELTYADYFVSFTFSVLDFTNPKKNRFRYMLEGFDPTWVENGNRNTATYTNLPSGKYTLRVQGANSSGAWNLEGISLSVVVLPAPWRTWWAYLLYGLTIALVLQAIRHFHRTNSAKKMALKEAEDMAVVADRVEDDLQEHQEEHDSLIRAVRDHNLFVLDLVASIVESELPAYQSLRAEKLTLRFRQQISVLGVLEEFYLYQTNGLVASLDQFTNILISKKLREMDIEPESIMSTNAVTNRPISADIASPVALIIAELLDNSLAHAFPEPSLSRFVQIDFDFDEPPGARTLTYKISVSDNGIGMGSSPLSDHSETTGFLLIKAMVNILGGRISVNSEHGTTVTVSFNSDH